MRTKKFQVVAIKVSVTGGGTVPINISATGVKATVLDGGPKITKGTITVFVDRDGNGKPDPTEIVHEREVEDPDGTSELDIGEINVEVGGHESPVKGQVIIKLQNGTTYRDSTRLY
ncbi:MAG: hypothetical protein KF841_03390 [Phycisphaerae bacterium]|nr:hypothetical protein [Phycisphaerae bacterium]